jgi:hypothetical protein
MIVRTDNKVTVVNMRTSANEDVYLYVNTVSTYCLLLTEKKASQRHTMYPIVTLRANYSQAPTVPSLIASHLISSHHIASYKISSHT